MRGAVQDLDVVVARRRAGRRSRRCRRARRRRRPAPAARPAAARATAATIASRFVGLVVGRQDEPDGGRLAGIPGNLVRPPRVRPMPMRNAEIAAAMTELGDPLRARRRHPLPRDRLQGGGAGDPPEPGLGRGAGAGRARRPSCPGSATRCRRRSSPWLETGEIPAATKLKAKFPASLVEVTRIPGLGAKTARQLYDELGVASLDELRAAAEGEQIRAAQGPRAEGRGERARGAGEARRGGPGRAAAALRGAPGRRGAGGGAARPPGLRRGRDRRLGAAAGRDLQGHRPDRDRERPEGARARR